MGKLQLLIRQPASPGRSRWPRARPPGL
uniref:Uncharacterized protein n=1 Tax=Arundo donax TaxID=35708 RepID=A0A0A9GK10_ARUDO